MTQPYGTQIFPHTAPHTRFTAPSASDASTHADDREHDASVERSHREDEAVHPVQPRVGDALSLQQIEQAHIRGVLARSPSLDAAAKTLGIDVSTLYRKRKLYGLQ
ncbi:MAG: hypothetical protein E6K53_06040 [Gammaproteobacteria bacterium]|nr:MAG: hypothetical protein E6K53_06040 [Gammaproteobacteria bacterium]